MENTEREKKLINIIMKLINTMNMQSVALRYAKNAMNWYSDAVNTAKPFDFEDEMLNILRDEFGMPLVKQDPFEKKEAE